MVISATIVSGADRTEAQKRSSENGKRRALFCALNIQCSTRYSQGKVGKEWTLKGPGNHLEHKRQRIHTCLGHRVLLWNVGYCLFDSTHCLCSSFLHCLAPHTLLFSNSLSPCLWLNSHNVKVLECTQRPQKEVESCVRQEGDLDFEGIFTWHQKCPWQEAAIPGHPGHTSYKFSTLFFQTTKCTKPKHTKSSGLACPWFTVLPRKTVLFPLPGVILPSLCEYFLIPPGGGSLRPCSPCPFSIWEWSNSTVKLEIWPSIHARC